MLTCLCAACHQNSLVETGPPTGHRHRDTGPGLASIGQGEYVATPGLQNEYKEYNCFLNVIVQCLWHCRTFLEPVLERATALEAAGEVPRELIRLLRTFESEVRLRSEAATADEQGIAQRRQVVAPTRLRIALDKIKKGSISVGAQRTLLTH